MYENSLNYNIPDSINNSIEPHFRQELRRFMRQVKRQNPEKTCFLEYDKLYVDHKPYVWNEVNSNIIAIYDIDELL